MRRSIIKQLIDWSQQETRRPLIVDGARQVGKTHALQTFGREHFKRMHYFNFEKVPTLCDDFAESLDPKDVIQALSFRVGDSIDLSQDLIILDEIQECPNALTSLKYFCEEYPNSYICAAGSLLGVVLAPVSFPVGKVDRLEMHPMTFVEFLQALEKNQLVELLERMNLTRSIPAAAHEQLWAYLKYYFITGGLPEVVDIFRRNQADLFDAFIQVRQKQSSLLKDYFADIAKHSGKVNAMHIQRLLHAVPEQLGRNQDGSATKFRFKNAIAGVDRFSKIAPAIDWLKSAGLLIKVNIINQGKLPFKFYVQENTFKLFVFDVGLLGALSELPPKTILDYDYGSFKGFFAENFVAQAFEASGRRSLYAWNEGTAEVEFLSEQDGVVVPIEVKSGWVTQAKSLRVFAQKYRPAYRVIMSAKPMHIDRKHKIHHYPLYLAGLFPLVDTDVAN